MKIILRKNRKPVKRLHKKYASLKLQLALRPFAWLVDSVSVNMTEHESSCGKRNHRVCRLLIQTTQGGIIVESATSTSWLVAVNRVIRKATLSLRETVDQLQIGSEHAALRGWRSQSGPALIPVATRMTKR